MADRRGADIDQLIAAIQRGERGELRVRICTYNGSKPYLDVRHWYPDESTGELRPGKGVTVRSAEIADVIAALRKAEGMMESAGRMERQPRRAQPDNRRGVLVEQPSDELEREVREAF